MLGTVPDAPPKEKKGIAPVSEKKKAQLKEEKPKRDQQVEWFAARIKEMKGECLECSKPINKDVFAFAVMSVAHVLPKRNNMFPSVATHKNNSLELCVDCHSLYDRSWDDACSMKVWPLAVDKFISIYPSIAANERKHLPEILRQEVL